MFEEKAKLKIGITCLILGIAGYVFSAYKPEFLINDYINFILTIGGALIGTHWATDMMSLKTGHQQPFVYDNKNEIESEKK